jgi:hypothetical protein
MKSGISAIGAKKPKPKINIRRNWRSVRRGTMHLVQAAKNAV